MEVKPVQEEEFKPLEPKQLKFCYEYVKDRNGTQAYVRAGYAGKGARASASKLLTNPNVRHKINQLIAEQIDRIKLDTEFVIRELLKHATIDLADAYDENGELKDIKDMPEPLRKAIVAIETEELFDGQGKDREQIGYAKKIKLCDKTKSLELLGKHLKMFTDVTEHRAGESLAEALKQARQRTKKCHNSPPKKKK